MKKEENSLIYVLLFLLSGIVGNTVQVSAANPFLPLWAYIPDGEPYIFEDPDRPGEYRVYIYGSNDSMKTEYCGREQVLWSASINDLNNWRYDGIIFESRLDANGNLLNRDGVGDILYAPDIVEVVENGKKTYYFYPNNQGYGRNGMIAKADRPDGPFKVCNWNPDIPAEVIGDLQFDPAVFVDDDGKVYGYWGFKESWGAELDPYTMATIKKGTQPVKDMISGMEQDGEFRFFEASSIRKIKDKYVFIYSRWTADGEFGLPGSNYTLAYAYSNSPLGPFTYGGTIIDARSRDIDPEGNPILTATPGGNTHGSILEINGQWYVFYHRQIGTSAYARQAMVGTIEVNVVEGEGGKVEITEAAYTSEGFELEGLNPFKKYPAGIACYYTGPEPAYHLWPDFIYPGSYVHPVYPGGEVSGDLYDLSINRNPVVNNTDGSVVGYKYFNFDLIDHKSKIGLAIHLRPQGVDGTVDIMIGSPWKSRGGTQVGSLQISKDAPQVLTEMYVPVSGVNKVKGKEALYFVFRSGTGGRSICELYDFNFTESVDGDI